MQFVDGLMRQVPNDPLMYEPTCVCFMAHCCHAVMPIPGLPKPNVPGSAINWGIQADCQKEWMDG